MAIAASVVLVIAALVAVQFLVLPALWAPRTEPDPYQDECRRAGPSQLSRTTHSPSGTVRVIRLTDDGEFADRCELTDVLYDIRNRKESELVVWYIHGWKHNADDDDPDLMEFTNLIKALDEQERKGGHSTRHVVGVYVGWDGAVGPAVLRNLTFWNRKRAADRISQSAVVTRIFASAKYARMQAGEKATSRDLTIMIGHSFGARILYTATSQVLIDEVQRRHPGNKEGSYGVIKGPADLIVLLNPAFEASIFTAMHGIRRPAPKEWERIHRDQRPLLLAIATENDRATGRMFPLGQSVEFARTSRQRETLGNHGAYVTHELKAVSPSDGPSTSRFWFDSFEAAGLVLQRKEGVRHPGNPFIVARTTPDVIDGHNGIWGKDLRNWVIAFLRRLQDPAFVPSETERRSSEQVRPAPESGGTLDYGRRADTDGVVL